MEVNMGMKRFIRVDLGKKIMHVTILQENCKPVFFKEKTTIDGCMKMIKELQDSDTVALEAGNLAFSIARQIQKESSAQVLVLNPGKLSTIYNSLKKTDKEDSLKLARLIQRIPASERPTVTLPTELEEEERSLIREITFLRQQRNRLVCRLHSVFVNSDLVKMKRSNLRTEGNREIAMEELEGRFLKEAQNLHDLLNLSERQIKEMEIEVKNYLNKDQAAPFLLSIPGVGPITALAFLAYVGDGSRFSSASQVSYYEGMVPRVDISSDQE